MHIPIANENTAPVFERFMNILMPAVTEANHVVYFPIS